MAVAGEQEMQDFVRNLFQGSPDLSTLTHAIVRTKYLAHVGQDTLTKEEKEQMKRLVEKELVQMQVEDSSSCRVLQTSVIPGGQKRHLCPSDTSGDEVKSRQKKQRTGKELEVSSDEQDSGIDSKKIPVYGSTKSAGKFLGPQDEGDSGAEDHSDGSGSNRQSAKKRSRGAVGRTAAQEHPSGNPRSASGSDSEELKGSDLEEEIRGCKRATEGHGTESDVEQELKGCKLQKKGAFSKPQKWTGRLERGKNSRRNEERRRKESESEEECERLQVGKTRAKKTVDGRDYGAGKAGGGIQKGESKERQRKVQEESESDSEDDDDRGRKKVPSKKQGRKSEESESDSENPEDGRLEKEKPKTGRAGEEKCGHRLKSNLDPREKPARQIGKGRVTKTQRKNETGRRGLEEAQGGRMKCHSPKRQQGRQKPKRSASSSSSDESEREMGGSKGRKKKGSGESSSEGDGSRSEAAEGGQGGSSNEPESGSERSDVGDRRKEKTVRKWSKDPPGSKDEKSKDRGAVKSQKESVSEGESEEGSGSELEGKKKPGGQQKKAPPKPRRRRNSKEAPENDSVEEKGDFNSEENPHHSKQRHRGKDRDHSGKSEDHPSVQRLKRYIRECGLHRNYKKLLAGCRSRRAQVEALKQELENIGLKGTPSLAKCRALKKKREEAAEVASLDLGNIIATEGRPRRRNVWSLYSKPQESSSSPEESPIRRPATDWSRLRGVISSDGESN